MDSDTQPKRKPAVERLLSELTKADSRASVFGVVSDKNPNNLTARLSHNDNSLDLVFADKEQFGEIKNNDFCRAIGRILYNNDLPTINVETIHKLENFDLKLWKKVRDLERLSD